MASGTSRSKRESTVRRRPTRASVATARSRAPGGIVIGANGTRARRGNLQGHRSYACSRRATRGGGRSEGLEQLTGLRLAAWAVLGALAVGVFLVLQSAWGRRRGGPGGGALLGIAAGAGVVAIVIGRDLDALARLPDVFLARPISVLVAIGAVGVAFALVDVAWVRGLPILARAIGAASVPADLRSDAAVAVLSLGIAVVTLVGLVRLDRTPITSGGIASGPSPTGTPGVGSPAGTPVPGAGWFVGVRTFDLPAGALPLICCLPVPVWEDAGHCGHAVAARV